MSTPDDLHRLEAMIEVLHGEVRRMKETLLAEVRLMRVELERLRGNASPQAQASAPGTRVKPSRPPRIEGLRPAAEGDYIPIQYAGKMGGYSASTVARNVEGWGVRFIRPFGPGSMRMMRIHRADWEAFIIRSGSAVPVYAAPKPVEPIKRRSRRANGELVPPPTH